MAGSGSSSYTRLVQVLPVLSGIVSIQFGPYENGKVNTKLVCRRHFCFGKPFFMKENLDQNPIPENIHPNWIVCPLPETLTCEVFSETHKLKSQSLDANSRTSSVEQPFKLRSYWNHLIHCLIF